MAEELAIDLVKLVRNMQTQPEYRALLPATTLIKAAPTASLMHRKPEAYTRPMTMIQISRSLQDKLQLRENQLSSEDGEAVGSKITTMVICARNCMLCFSVLPFILQIT